MVLMLRFWRLSSIMDWALCIFHYRKGRQFTAFRISTSETVLTRWAGAS